MIITSQTQVTVKPSEVEYRDLMGSGIRLVRVWFDSKNPRVLAQVEYLSPEGIQVAPMSLFLDEILMYVTDGRERLGL